ncbi:trypsin-like isoform X2 [Culex pipiens pallens]|uniref:trypsin-like isoform X2 n=1 Tax=Culex pipiens pallens TaxID=42434 RepID=UPI0022AAB738|nr:trypsin-like isoform X2 [Culex pipiens pallens]
MIHRHQLLVVVLAACLPYWTPANAWARPEEEGAASPLQRDSQGLECAECVCGGVTSPGTRVVGGNSSDLSAFPWMASLFQKGVFSCGASLINDRYVLTAAHCVARADAREFEVFLRRPSITVGNPEMIHRRGHSITLNHYQGIRINNDVALIRLAEPVPLGPDVIPVCLPTGTDSYQGQKATVTGWGTTESGELSDTLQQLTVPILSNQECKRAGYFRFQITNRMLCAGFLEGGKDSCQGDSGGPLQLRNPTTGRYDIIGVVSWGKACAQRNYPGVYARVTKFVAWVRSTARDACWCQQ